LARQGPRSSSSSSMPATAKRRPRRCSRTSTASSGRMARSLTTQRGTSRSASTEAWGTRVGRGGVQAGARSDQFGGAERPPSAAEGPRLPGDTGGARREPAMADGGPPVEVETARRFPGITRLFLNHALSSAT
jgi:hypothetical protein